jgi:hypothetical protein
MLNTVMDERLTVQSTAKVIQGQKTSGARNTDVTYHTVTTIPVYKGWRNFGPAKTGLVEVTVRKR